MGKPQTGGQTQNVFGQASQALGQGLQTTAQATGFRPMAIGAPTGQQMQQYMNPYESQVVQQSLGDLERSRQMAQNVGGAQATAAGAFGGSRHGIAEAETNRAFAEQAAKTASGLRQAGYGQAQQLARSADLANQQAQLSGAQFRLGAGQQLANIGNLGFGMGRQIQQDMLSQGAQQQALQQAIIDAGKQQWQGYAQAPQQAASPLLTALGAVPMSQTQTTTPGLLDYITGIGSAYGTYKGLMG